MTPTDNEVAIGEIINRLARIFRPYDWSDEALEGYVWALGDLPAEAVGTAAGEWIRAGEPKMPFPKQLRVAVLDATTGRPPTAGDAWAEVCAEISRVGRTDRPTFSHPLIARAVMASGGWIQLCNSERPDLERRSFTNVYDSLCERADHETLVAPALGGALEVTERLAAKLRPLYAINGTDEDDER